MPANENTVLNIWKRHGQKGASITGKPWIINELITNNTTMLTGMS